MADTWMTHKCGKCHNHMGDSNTYVCDHCGHTICYNCADREGWRCANCATTNIKFGKYVLKR